MIISKFDSNSFYHLYNRSIGSELLFQTERDYFYFLQKMRRYLLPYATIIAYCLIPNHFHILFKTNENINCMEMSGPEKYNIDQSLKNLFNSYSKSYNNAHIRQGKLFLHGYKLKQVNSDEYLTWLIYYIHRNPVHHGLTKKCEDWMHSSYHDIINEKDKYVSQLIFDLYGSKSEFIDFTYDLTENYLETDFNFR